MRQIVTRGLAAVFTACLLAVLLVPLQAASPYAGKWKLVVTTMPEGVDHALFLVKIDVKPSASKGFILSTPVAKYENAVIDDVAAGEKTLSFVIQTGDKPMPVALNKPAGDGEPKRLVGSCEFEGKRVFIRAERTTEFEIKKDKAESPLAGIEELRKAQASTFASEKLSILKDVLTRYGETPLAYYARLENVAALAASGAAEAEVKAEIDRAVKIAESYDPGMKAAAQAQALHSEATGLRANVASLKNVNKPAELAAAEARLNKLEKSIDTEELKAGLPFKVDEYKGRKGKSERVVLLELFTGSSCPPCVAADVAFDGLLLRYKPSEVIFLQYHQNIPATDPMTVPDGEMRAEFYEIGGTPTIFINGREGPAVGGGKPQAQAGYNRLASSLDSALEVPAQAKVNLTVKKQGEVVDIKGEATEVKGAGDNARLRLVLVEESIKFDASNGLKVHHHVVRGFPGGVKGAAIKEDKGELSAKVNLGTVARDLAAAVDKLGMPNTEKVAELKRLKVVAFVQNDKTKEVIQAAEFELGDAK